MADGPRSCYDRALTPGFAALAGLGIAPSFVLTSSLPMVAAQLTTMFLLATAAAIRLRPLRTALFMVLVVAFNLLSPAGRVLLTVVGQPITVGALTLGLERAATLTSLLLLSKLAIRPGLQLPGRFGALVALTLRYLRELLSLPVVEVVRRPTARIDALLLQLHNERRDSEPDGHAGNTPAGSAPHAVVMAALLLGGSWMVVLIG